MSAGEKKRVAFARPGSARRLSPLARVLDSMVGGLDRILARPGNVAPVSTELSRRHAWGLLQRGPGPALGAKKQLALSFDLDYQEDTDALAGLLPLLRRVGARASFAAIGLLVEADPGPYQRAVAAGHEIINHTYSHPDNPVLNPDREFWHLSAEEMAEEVGQAQDLFERLLGVRPSGFRSPHFKDAHRMLAAIESFPEMTYVTSVVTNDSPTGLPYFPLREPIAGERSYVFGSDPAEQGSRLLMVPLSPCPVHRWSPFCSYHAIRRPRDARTGRGLHDLAEFAALWEQLLARASRDEFAAVYFDPKDITATPDTLAVFEQMLVSATACGWHLTTFADVARLWAGYFRAAPAPVR